MKKSFVLLFVILILFTGCIPTQYKDGVSYKQHYPYDELPVYENAVVYDCETLGDTATIRYGTTDDVGAVFIYYNNYFVANNISAEQDGSEDIYYAKGLIDNKEFQIKAVKAEGQYEEKVYNTVVEVIIKKVRAAATETVVTPEITPEITPEPTIDPALGWDGGQPLLVKMQGFWIAESINGERYSNQSVAFEIFDYTMTNYAGSREPFETFEFEIIDESTVKNVYDDYEIISTIVFREENGKAYMTMDNGDMVVDMYLSEFDAFMQ